MNVSVRKYNVIMSSHNITSRCHIIRDFLKPLPYRVVLLIIQCYNTSSIHGYPHKIPLLTLYNTIRCDGTHRDCSYKCLKWKSWWFTINYHQLPTFYSTHDLNTKLGWKQIAMFISLKFSICSWLSNDNVGVIWWWPGLLGSSGNSVKFDQITTRKICINYM